MLNPTLSYAICVGGIARSIYKGRRSRAVGRLKKWAKTYSYRRTVPITPLDMLGDALAEINKMNGALHYFRDVVPGEIEAQKEWGREDYYNFELSSKRLPFDEATALAQLYVRRLENAPSILDELEV